MLDYCMCPKCERMIMLDSDFETGFCLYCGTHISYQDSREFLLEGLKSADPLLLEMGKVYAFTPFQVFRYIYLPALVPYALAAVRTGLGFAWKAGIAGEVLAIPTGAMGTQLHTAKVTLETTDLFAWTAAIILLSLALEKGAVALVKCLSRRYTPPKKENMSC